MNKEQLAEQLNGIEYPCNIPNEIQSQAKSAGLVIVFGASDDLIEFRGAIRDEYGVYEGETVKIDAKGVICIEAAYSEGLDEVTACVARLENHSTITANWLPSEEISWSYTTDIPHKTFDVMEDGETYCRGIVFNIADLAAKDGSVNHMIQQLRALKAEGHGGKNVVIKAAHDELCFELYVSPFESESVAPCVLIQAS